MKTLCKCCKKKTEHRHMHDAAHGMEGTHMAGTERYECEKCGNPIYADNGRKMGLKYILD